MNFSKNELQSLAILENLSEELIVWLSKNGTRIDLKPQDHLFMRGQKADYMFIIIKGKIERFQKIDGQNVVAATTLQGQVTGMLPFSRMTHYPGNAIAAEPSRILRINKKHFNQMLEVSHEFGQRLVAEMSNRVRKDVRLEQQWEKMVSLGKLSAGLAHELNNPIAAIRSTTSSLKDQLENQNDFIMNQILNIQDKNVSDAVQVLLNLAGEKDPSLLAPLERSELEGKLTDWLDKKSITNSWKLATVFSSTGIKTEELEKFSSSISSAHLETLLSWIAGKIEVDRMLLELTYAAGRVSELVSLVKNYSHMDQSSEYKPVKINEGINNTLLIFRHKLDQKNIQVIKKFQADLPLIHANGGELNQVWTYLIDNAIDAMSENGKLCIETNANKLNVEIKIIDNGQGIPEAIINRIFDPFFTTKDVGEGTGLGLDIARRIVQTHRGQIDVQSKPGRTEMSVRLPIQTKK